MKMLTWASPPEETNTFRVLENVRPVTRSLWPLRLVMTLYRAMGNKHQILLQMGGNLSRKWITNYLIQPCMIYDNRGVIHSDGDYVVVLRIESKTGCSWWGRHESCHWLQIHNWINSQKNTIDLNILQKASQFPLNLVATNFSEQFRLGKIPNLSLKWITGIHPLSFANV